MKNIKEQLGSITYSGYCNANIFLRLKYWLIRVIVGDTSVILNVNLTIEDRDDNRASITIPELDGGLFGRLNLNIPDGRQMRIGKWED